MPDQEDQLLAGLFAARRQRAADREQQAIEAARQLESVKSQFNACREDVIRPALLAMQEKLQANAMGSTILDLKASADGRQAEGISFTLSPTSGKAASPSELPSLTVSLNLNRNAVTYTNKLSWPRAQGATGPANSDTRIAEVNDALIRRLVIALVEAVLPTEPLS